MIYKMPIRSLPELLVIGIIGNNPIFFLRSNQCPFVLFNCFVLSNDTNNSLHHFQFLRKKTDILSNKNINVTQWFITNKKSILLFFILLREILRIIALSIIIKHNRGLLRQQK